MILVKRIMTLDECETRQTLPHFIMHLLNCSDVILEWWLLLLFILVINQEKNQRVCVWILIILIILKMRLVEKIKF